MKATKTLHDLGQSLWLDNITRDLLNSGTLRRYIDELSVTGLTSNPTIFDHAIKNSTRLRRGDPRKLSEGQIGRGLFFELALEDITRPPICSGRSTTGQRRGRLGVAGSLAAAGPRHRPAPWRRPRNCSAAPDSPTVHQDSRHQGRLACHRRSDLRRRAGQRHAAVSRASSTWRRRRRTCAASSGASMPGSIRCRLRRLGVHQPLGRRRHGQGAGGAERPARHRHRQAYLQGVPRAA